MSHFLGTHLNRLDAKGRVSIPAPFRAALRGLSMEGTPPLVLRPSHKHPCIEAWPASVFASLATPLDQLDIFGEDHDDLASTVYADAYPVESDREGRIVLADGLVRYACLTDTVIFMGLGRTFQIWEPQAAERRRAEARDRARVRGLTLSSAPAMATAPMSPQASAGTGHVPVMLDEVLAALEPACDGRYLDATFGGGGYARAILSAASCTLWAIDRDPEAIARGAALAAAWPGRLHLVEGRFGDMVALLASAGVSRLDGVVLDLGVSSFQIDTASRGFSFRAEGPLDMRMGDAGPSAAELVATLSERDLADTLYKFGEERASRRIARAIVSAREEAAIETTSRLAEIIRGVMPAARDGLHPATRSFQALRIRVNDELGEIERGLEAAASLLAPGGRLVVVSFHSLEDRLVKRFFTAAAGRAPAPSRHDPRGLGDRTQTEQGRAGFRLLATRAARPGPHEIARNPRARSARLRALEKLPPAPEASQ